LVGHILNPFGKIISGKHSINDCLPIALFFVYSSIIPKKAITRLFNHTDALSFISKFLPYWIKVIFIFVLGLVPVFFSILLLYLYRINEKVWTTAKTFLITTILLIVISLAICIPIELYVGMDG
jgi:hypothetical protein